jgi:hypothetical protein
MPRLLLSLELRVPRMRTKIRESGSLPKFWADRPALQIARFVLSVRHTYPAAVPAL